MNLYARTTTNKPKKTQTRLELVTEFRDGNNQNEVISERTKRYLARQQTIESSAKPMKIDDKSNEGHPMSTDNEINLTTHRDSIVSKNSIGSKDSDERSSIRSSNMSDQQKKPIFGGSAPSQYVINQSISSFNFYNRKPITDQSIKTEPSNEHQYLFGLQSPFLLSQMISNNKQTISQATSPDQRETDRKLSNDIEDLHEKSETKKNDFNMVGSTNATVDSGVERHKIMPKENLHSKRSSVNLSDNGSIKSKGLWSERITFANDSAKKPRVESFESHKSDETKLESEVNTTLIDFEKMVDDHLKQTEEAEEAQEKDLRHNEVEKEPELRHVIIEIEKDKQPVITEPKVDHNDKSIDTETKRTNKSSANSKGKSKKGKSNGKSKSSKIRF